MRRDTGRRKHVRLLYKEPTMQISTNGMATAHGNGGGFGRLLFVFFYFFGSEDWFGILNYLFPCQQILNMIFNCSERCDHEFITDEIPIQVLSIKENTIILDRYNEKKGIRITTFCSIHYQQCATQIFCSTSENCVQCTNQILSIKSDNHFSSVQFSSVIDIIFPQPRLTISNEKDIIFL